MKVMLRLQYSAYFARKIFHQSYILTFVSHEHFAGFIFAYIGRCIHYVIINMEWGGGGGIMGLNFICQ